MKINEKFKTLIPALTAEEYNQLESNCLKDGILESIKVWNGYIIDGHNRFEIAQKHGLQFNTKEMNFETENDVIEWIILHQLGRRNLTDNQKSYLRGKRYENEKLKQGTNNQYIQSESGQNVHFQKTAEKIANETGVKERTIRRDEQFSKAIDKISNVVDNNLKQEILNNTIKVTKQEISKIAELPNENIKKIIETAKDKTEKGEKYKSLTSIIKENQKTEIQSNRIEKALPKEIQIFNADCIGILQTIPDNSIDCLLTDPPYAINFNHSWQNTTIKNDNTEIALETLQKVCSLLQTKCKKDAHLYFFSSWNQIDTFKQIIEKYFDISNILVWVKNNTSLVDFDKRYAFKYENIFFCKQKGNNDRVLNNKQSPDVLNFNRVNNPYHPTEKPIELLKYLIENSTVKNEMILDCFMGSGSTGESCLQLNRNFIGIELDEKFFNYAKNRLER